MSQYLNIYLIPKSKDENAKDANEEMKSAKPLLLVTFSSYSLVYQCFADNANVPYAIDGLNGDARLELTEDVLGSIINSLEEDIKNEEDTINLYEKYAATNQKYIYEILDRKKNLNDLLIQKHSIEFLNAIAYDIRQGWSGFEKIIANYN
jgi:methyltransferase-like protein